MEMIKTERPDCRAKTTRPSPAKWALKTTFAVITTGWFLVGGVEGGVAQGTGALVGRVVGAATDEPIASAQVSVVGTSLRSVTAALGWYLILGVPAGTHEVSASAVGYSPLTKQVMMEADGGAVVDFALHTSVVELDELVVGSTAGGAKRREVGNSLASLQGEQLDRQSGVGLGSALQGQIAGLQVASGGGQAGAGKILRLRGINSLTHREPLVFLDGIRLGRIGRASPGEARQVISFLDTLTPEDVVRIEVLRGSAATALYGSDGASGVILIYTR
jgi:TonB-dependent SusC/RagA subfamily outer membrane receptor